MPLGGTLGRSWEPLGAPWRPLAAWLFPGLPRTPSGHLVMNSACNCKGLYREIRNLSQKPVCAGTSSALTIDIIGPR